MVVPGTSYSVRGTSYHAIVIQLRSVAIHPAATRPLVIGGWSIVTYHNGMLHLRSETSARWLAQVDSDLPSILIDHAHCEKKAAGTALNLIFAYVEDIELCREMTEIVNEELEHFHLVLELLARRGIRFRRLTPSSYGRELNDLVRKQEPQRAVDRLLVAGLIEARSCERFHALAEHVHDAELADFYRSLFESEARHHTTYTRLAKHFAPEAAVMARLDELATAEASIIDHGEDLPRMHS
jgi:tRNA 2-(methylsulfanyl)-N6-isopentenyladenosine37 hydroxylase